MSGTTGLSIPAAGSGEARKFSVGALKLGPAKLGGLNAGPVNVGPTNWGGVP
jgi:hypothetical protein